ncbi:MAG: hypothetical protein JWN48_5660 [Myxococcaceae bacterium]|nr:hypothetical protein [Myxococcaceae bacterium]
MAIGFNLDLLPTVICAANKKLGYAPQVWLGVGHARIRFVGAHLQPLDAVAFAPHGFHHATTTVFASIIDYTFGSRFDGAWIGSGMEVWQRSIQHSDVAGRARWNSTVFTARGGYIWRFLGHFYVDPWAGVHATLNPQSVTLGAHHYKPFPLQDEASVNRLVHADLIAFSASSLHLPSRESAHTTRSAATRAGAPRYARERGARESVQPLEVTRDLTSVHSRSIDRTAGARRRSAQLSRLEASTC